MEGSSSTSHFRSISLPSRLIHPSSNNIEAKIYELKVLANFLDPTRDIQGSLVGLAELYVCVYELVRSPKTQQALSRQRNETLVEYALEGSICLLDSCNTLKEFFVSMKENVQILQSALRRKGGDSTVARKIGEYLCFRKKAKKSIIKNLGSLKHIEKKMALFSFIDVDYHLSMVTKLFGEVYALTISIFKSLLVFMSMKTTSSKVVELISRVLITKSTISTHDKNQSFVSEVDTLDLALTSLYKSVNNNETNNVEVQMILRQLQSFNVCIEGFETGLDTIFRRLIQTRVCLLNVIAC